MIWSFLLASLLTIAPGLSRLSQGILGLRTLEGRGLMGSAPSGRSVSFHLNNRLLHLIIPPGPPSPAFLEYLSSFCLWASSEWGVLLTCYINVRFWPGYPGRILMTEGGGGWEPVTDFWWVDNREMSSSVHLIQTVESGIVSGSKFQYFVIKPPLF